MLETGPGQEGEKIGVFPAIKVEGRVYWSASCYEHREIIVRYAINVNEPYEIGYATADGTWVSHSEFTNSNKYVRFRGG